MRKAVLILTLAAVALAGQREQSKTKPPRRQAECIIQVIEASSAPKAGNDAADRVPGELKNLLRYSRYGLLDSAFLRGLEGETHRIAVAGNLTGELGFRVRAGQEPPLIEVDLEITGPAAEKTRAPKLLETTATVKSGETVVLGASRMRGGGDALIVLLTVKLLP